MKKLRDSLKMKCIASYYIKTLFLWKIYDEKTKAKNEGEMEYGYWQKGLSVTFRSMVTELYNSIRKKSIPYFWNENLNMIANVKHTLLNSYANDLRKVLVSIDCNNVDKVVSYLLSPNEIQGFKKYEFLEQQPRKTREGSTASVISAFQTPTFPISRQGSTGSLKSACETPKQISRHGSTGSLTSTSEYSKVENPMKQVVDLLKAINSGIGALRTDIPKESNNKDDSEDGAAGILKSVNDNMYKINHNIENQNERLKKLELDVGVKKEKTAYNVDQVIAIGQRLQILEWNINHKGKHVVEVGEDDLRAEIEKNNNIPECSGRVGKQNRDNNDAVLDKLDEYNERIKKLEQRKVDDTNKRLDMKAWTEEFDSMVEQLERNKKPIKRAQRNDK